MWGWKILSGCRNHGRWLSAGTLRILALVLVPDQHGLKHSNTLIKYLKQGICVSILTPRITSPAASNKSLNFLLPPLSVNTGSDQTAGGMGLQWWSSQLRSIKLSGHVPAQMKCEVSMNTMDMVSLDSHLDWVERLRCLGEEGRCLW